ncbi:uncharacterized protein TNCV_4243861 [Trichonephila clavipes]|nr:uncharacterized protein TNCV_4243861 [Trichonephila clavipes]
MSGNKVRKEVMKFKDGRTNVHDEERSCWPSVIFNDSMQAVEAKFKLCSQRVPRLLTEGTQGEEVYQYIGLLIRYEEKGNDMLTGIVTGDETWVSHITPESKQ